MMMMMMMYERTTHTKENTSPAFHPAHNSLYNSPTDTQPLGTLFTRALRLAPVGLAMARRGCAIMFLLLRRR